MVSGRTTAAAVSAAINPVAPTPGRPVIAYDLGPLTVRTQDSAAVKVAEPSATAADGGTGTVKPEYARAGQWKAQPGPARTAAPAAAASE
jgi:hypothetical protein